MFTCQVRASQKFVPKPNTWCNRGSSMLPRQSGNRFQNGCSLRFTPLADILKHDLQAYRINRYHVIRRDSRAKRKHPERETQLYGDMIHERPSPRSPLSIAIDQEIAGQACRDETRGCAKVEQETRYGIHQPLPCASRLTIVVMPSTATTGVKV